MDHMTPERWIGTCDYLRDVFGNRGNTAPGSTGNSKDLAGRATRSPTGRIDETLLGWEQRANAAALPAIAISPDVGRFLTVLATLATSARTSTGRAIEVGTLGGYSAMWLARGMLAGTSTSAAPQPAPRLLTIEYDPKHTAFARAEFERAGLASTVELLPGAGLDVLARLSRELAPASVDLVFLDAEKTEYDGYTALAKPLLRRGGLLIADNALGSGNWWITDAPGAPPDARSRDSHAAIDAFNRKMAADPDFEASCVPIREGVLVAIKK